MKAQKLKEEDGENARQFKAEHREKSPFRY